MRHLGSDWVWLEVDETSLDFCRLRRKRTYGTFQGNLEEGEGMNGSAV